MLTLLAGPLAVLALVLLLLTLPVTAPLSAIFIWWGSRRLRAAADGTCCVRCGHVLGQAALNAADAHRAALGKLQCQHPNGLVNSPVGCCYIAWIARAMLLRRREAQSHHDHDREV